MTGITKKIRSLKHKNFTELKVLWQEYCQEEPPPLKHGFMRKALAHRIQELAYGAVSPEAATRLDKLMAEASGKKQRKNKPTAIPIAGTRLIREWHGKRYEVTVLPKGFEFEGKEWRSLTSIARHITGTRWNGPLFFGLRKQEKENT